MICVCMWRKSLASPALVPQALGSAIPLSFSRKHFEEIFEREIVFFLCFMSLWVMGLLHHKILIMSNCVASTSLQLSRTKIWNTCFWSSDIKLQHIWGMPLCILQHFVELWLASTTITHHIFFGWPLIGCSNLTDRFVFVSSDPFSKSTLTYSVFCSFDS